MQRSRRPLFATFFSLFLAACSSSSNPSGGSSEPEERSDKSKTTPSPRPPSSASSRGSSPASGYDSNDGDGIVTRCGTVGGVCLCQSFTKEHLADFEAQGWTETSCAAPAGGTCCMDDDFPARPGRCECGPVRCQGTTNCLCQITDDPTYTKTSCDSTECCLSEPVSVVTAACHCGGACKNNPEATPISSCSAATAACGKGQRQATSCN